MPVLAAMLLEKCRVGGWKDSIAMEEEGSEKLGALDGCQAF